MADQKPVVGIIMGSKSDLGVMEGCTAELEALGVPYELVIASAHRTPAKVHEWASTAADRGIKVIIAAAGKAAHLGGVVAAFTPLPVIAEAQSVSEKYLESIVVLLSRAGLVDGVRGKGGGYRLTRTPDQYAVGEILRLTEGSLAPVACLEGAENTCPRAGHCHTLPMWEKLDTIINDYLDSVSLADLLRETDGSCL